VFEPQSIAELIQPPVDLGEIAGAVPVGVHHHVGDAEPRQARQACSSGLVSS
jgi:hypothetical protein